MKEYIETMKKYTNFSGRASRKEYWTFIIINLLIGTAITLLHRATGSMLQIGPFSINCDWLILIFSLLVLIPSISVSVRRMHDINKSGGWVFITLVPIIGTIWFFVLTCLKSTDSENTFGNSL